MKEVISIALLAFCCISANAQNKAAECTCNCACCNRAPAAETVCDNNYSEIDNYPDIYTSPYSNIDTTGTNKVYEVVEQMPSFPGGNSAMMQYLANNIKYPVAAQEKRIQGRVVTSFIVEPDGSISNVWVTRRVHPTLDHEAMRVVRSMPRWNPGKQNGKAVRVKYNVPTSFRLQ